MTSSSAYVGQFGNNLGTTYDVQVGRFQGRRQQLGYTDFKSNLFLSGTDGDVVLQDLENVIEGNANSGDGVQGNLLSWDSYVESNSQSNNLIFGSNESNLFTNINFNNEEFSVMNEETFSSMLGMNWEGGKPYDVYDMGQNTIDFYEFKFTGFDDEDGQTIINANLSDFVNSSWGYESYINREVNTSYWDKDVDTSNPESIKAYMSLSEMIKTMNQWITDSDKEVLSQLDQGTSDYYKTLYALMVKHMDQDNVT